MFFEGPCLAVVACCTYLCFGVLSDITWIQGCAGLSMAINIHIFMTGEVLYNGYMAIVSYVLFVSFEYPSHSLQQSIKMYRRFYLDTKFH